MKVCVRCETPKDLNDFYHLPTARDKRQSWCKDCQKSYRKIWLSKHPLHKDRYDPNYQYGRRAANRHKLWDYLATHPCVDCAEKDPIILQFDHVRGEKVKAVKAMLLYSWESIDKEISKCEIRCANCHVRRTARQRHYWHP